MKIELFTICDGAFNYNGKLTIVGVTDGFKVHAIPIKISLSLAMRILIEMGECVIGPLKIILLDPQKKRIPVEITSDINVSAVTETSHISLATTIQGVPIEKEGIYSIIVQIKDQQLGEYSFFVKRNK